MPPPHTSSALSGYSAQYARVPGLGFGRNEVRDELSIAVFEPKTDMPSEAIPPKMAKFGEAPLNVERDLSGYWRE